MKAMRSLLAAVIIIALSVQAASSAEILKKLESLEEIDYIRISGYIRSGDLYVTIIYKNMASGRLVYWEDGKVDVKCEVYENIGDTIDRKRGQRIAVVSKNITNYDEDLRIKIPKMGKDKRGLIYCTVDTGYKEVSARGDFWFR